MKFTGIMLGSDNSPRLGEFYAQILGKPGYEANDSYGWDEGVQLFIAPHSEVDGPNKNPQRIIFSITVDNVQSSFDELIGLGAGVIAAPYSPDPSSDMLIATVSDPDGNYLQLAKPWR